MIRKKRKKEKPCSCEAKEEGREMQPKGQTTASLTLLRIMEFILISFPPKNKKDNPTRDYTRKDIQDKYRLSSSHSE